MVGLVEQSISADASVEDVMAWFTERIPAIYNGWDLDEDETEDLTTLQRMRQYESRRNLPWITRLAERNGLENGLEELWIMGRTEFADSVLRWHGSLPLG